MFWAPCIAVRLSRLQDPVCVSYSPAAGSDTVSHGDKGRLGHVTEIVPFKSVSTLSAFMLAMVLYPEVQKKAQAQLDAVVGSSRLPSFSDRQELPYITVIEKETIRWHSVAPQGLPHQLKADDVYNGMFIPKGSIIIANSRYVEDELSIFSPPLSCALTL